nr:hypothetical protein [Tanacetum cinerariifolium]
KAPGQKGVGAGLVFIDPSETEYTYAIWITFLSTNNEAEYETAGWIENSTKDESTGVRRKSRFKAGSMSDEWQIRSK